MVNTFEAQVVYKLESVDFERKTGVLKIKEDKRYSHWIARHVSISGLLLYRIKEKKYDGLKRNDRFIGTEYISRLNSSKYNENPFRLVEFIPDKNSDIPRNFRLELVFEMFSERIERLNAFHKAVVVGYKNRKLKPTQYLRFQQIKVTKRQSECKNVRSFNNLI